jgi:sugar/nucleoside kinase (ribokinase family)
VKRGSAAAICRSGQEQYSLMPPSVKTVDDIGAGDSFDAGFIHKFTAGAKLEDCLAFANLGAYSTTKEGGTEAFRDRDALVNFVRQHGVTAGQGLPS